MLISARDLGVPSSCVMSRNATVTVKVGRNENAPVFSNDGSYRAVVTETLGVGNRVTVVSTSDRDSEVGHRCQLRTSHTCVRPVRKI